MSSSQTLTTSLMGHPPHDATSDRSTYELCEAQAQPDDQYPAHDSAAGNTAKLDLPNKSAFNQIQAAQNTFSALSGMSFPIRSLAFVVFLS